MTHPAAVDFVLSIPLPEVGPQFESVESTEAPISFGDSREAVVVGAQVAEFSPQIPAAQRAALTDCLLLAQLAANGMLGPVGAAASLVVSILNGLREMNKDSPWITVFDRASRHSSGARFQFGFVDVGPDPASVSIKLLAIAIDASRTITQVLFFKFSKQDAKLRRADGRLGIEGARLDSIKEAVAARVRPFLIENISKIEI